MPSPPISGDFERTTDVGPAEPFETMNSERLAPSTAKPASAPCRRCGTCCRKGGPALHRADRHLVESGRISPTTLYAIRAGEPARDNVADRIVVLDADIVKIRGTGESPVCVCYDPARGCTVYADRPLECRVLDCRDTDAVARLYARDRLTRRDLFGSVPGLWDLIAEHQTRCGYDRVRRAIAELEGPDRERGLARLSEMLQFDRLVRTEPVRTGRVPEGWTDLLFGRPLPRTLRGFGLRVAADGDRFRVRPLPPTFPPTQGDSPCSTSTSC